MASLNYIDAWQKATNDTFKQRLRVALTRFSQLQLQRSQNTAGGESAERYTALQDLARVVLVQVRQPDWLTGAALYAVLPWASVGNTVDDDETLQSRVEVIFDQLGSAPIVSP